MRIQTAEFVAHRLGEETSPVTCGYDALRRIVAHSHGVPGTIDRLMTDAVRLARLSRSARLTATVIDMIADDEHPPGEQRPVAGPPRSRRSLLPAARRKPVATAQPAPQQSAYSSAGFDQTFSPIFRKGTRSMRTVLTGLQETPASLYGHDDER